MKKLVILIVAGSIGLALAAPVRAQTDDSAPALKTTLSDKPFFNTESVLSLSGNYVNSPKEDFLESGAWNLPLTLDQMDGLIAGVSFGAGEEQGQWQLTYNRKLMTMDPSWHTIANTYQGLLLSDRRSQVLKADYNVRNWWRVGVATFVEDKYGDGDGGMDPDTIPLLPGDGQALGFQIDTTFKF